MSYSNFWGTPLQTYSQNFGAGSTQNTPVFVPPYAGAPNPQTGLGTATGTNTGANAGNSTGNNTGNNSGAVWTSIADIIGSGTDLTAMLLGYQKPQQQQADIIAMQQAQEEQRRQTRNYIYLGLGALVVTVVVVMLVKYSK